MADAHFFPHGHAPEYYFREGCFITELSNSPLDEEVSIAQARVIPGQSTLPHALDGITERYVILHGHGIAHIGDSPAQPVGPGDVLIIPPSCAQHVTNCGSEDLIFLVICSPRFVPQAYRDLSATA